MKKRWPWLVLGLVVVTCACILLEPTAVVRGFLRGESFYRARPTSYWRTALRASDPKVQADSVQALKDGRKEALPVLMELVQDIPDSDWSSVEVWCQAADLLGNLQSEARPALPALLAAIHAADPHVRSVALKTIAHLGVAPPATMLPDFIALLETDDCLYAGYILAGFGSQARAAVAPLGKLLKNSDPNVRRVAADTLGGIGADAREAVPALIAALADKEARVREHAAEALGRIGPAASAAVVPLAMILRDPDARVRRDAVRSLGQIGPASRSALAEIRKLLQDKDAKVRGAAGMAIKEIEAEQN